MPIPPPPIFAPYDSLETVLNVARTRLNDAIASLGGDILTDTQPFTLTMTNSAWRMLQAYLCNLGYSRYKRKFWAYALPAADSQDPSTNQVWSWTQFVNCSGAVYAPPTVDLLPQDFIAPLVIKERQTGNNQPFSRMGSAPDGLPEGRKRSWNGIFEWKNDGIYFPGSTFSMDFEVQYAAYDYDFSEQSYWFGAASVTNGSPDVTGIGTQWNSTMTGWTLTVNGVQAIVQAVNTNTSLTLIAPFSGSTASSATYALSSTSSYAIGTVSVTNGLSAVAGIGTNWTSSLNGNSIIVNGTQAVVQTVQSPTALTLQTAFSGTTAGSASYAIVGGWQTSQVPIMRSQSAFANYLAAEVSAGRSDVDVAAFVAAAEMDSKLLMNNSDVKLKERRPVQRRPYAGRGRPALWGNQGY